MISLGQLYCNGEPLGEVTEVGEVKIENIKDEIYNINQSLATFERISKINIVDSLQYDENMKNILTFLTKSDLINLMIP